MAKIKFSHDYMKLPEDWDDTEAFLLHMQTAYKAELEKKCPALLKWDTKFRNEEGSYPLPDGRLIILFFTHLQTGQVFTTMRRWTEEKENYYDRMVGDVFIMNRTYEE